MVTNPDYMMDVEEPPIHFFRDICSQLNRMRAGVFVQTSTRLCFYSIVTTWVPIVVDRWVLDDFLDATNNNLYSL